MAAAAKAATPAARFLRRASHRRHLIFGANTDVGKTLTSAGLVRASLMQDNSDNTSTVHYIKPLQCGGSDEGFIEKHCMPNINNNITNNNRSVAGSTTSNNNSSKLQCQTLFSWETPASPHIASRQENIPRSDKEVLGALDAALVEIVTSSNPSSSPMTTTWIETAGGVLSPSSASADNQSPYHASSSYTDTNNSNGSWGWLTQGDLYKPLSESASVVLCGDGRLGGISATLSSLESLMIRGYNVAGIVFLETGFDNVSAIREYAARQEKLHTASGVLLFQDPFASIVSLPPIPPEPEPLHEWYDSAEVTETLGGFNTFLQDHWKSLAEA